MRRQTKNLRILVCGSHVKHNRLERNRTTDERQETSREIDDRINILLIASLSSFP